MPTTTRILLALLIVTSTASAATRKTLQELYTPGRDGASVTLEPHYWPPKPQSLPIQVPNLPKGWSAALYASERQQIFRLQLSRKVKNVSETATLVSQPSMRQLDVNKTADGEFIAGLMFFQRPETARFRDSAPVSVRLTERLHDNNNKHARRSQNFQYQDIREFIWDRHDLFEQHMHEPVGVAGLWPWLAPDERVASQVFAADYTPDPAVRQQVEQLLPKLESSEFSERDAASRELESLGEAGAIALSAVSTE